MLKGKSPIKAGANIVIDSPQKLAAVKLPDSEKLFLYSRAGGKHGHDPQVLLLSTGGKTVL